MRDYFRDAPSGRRRCGSSTVRRVDTAASRLGEIKARAFGQCRARRESSSNSNSGLPGGHAVAGQAKNMYAAFMTYQIEDPLPTEACPSH